MEGRLRTEHRGRQGKLWRAYKLYVLVVMMVLYLINQMDRFVLGIGSQSISQDLQFGEMSCHPNASLSNGSCQDECSTLHNQTTCREHGECHWVRSGTGIEYQVLAGPAFILVFTLSALPMGILATLPRIRRQLVLGVFVLLWSCMTLLAGFTKAFWQLLLTRIGLGIFEAACTPFASSIIADYFEQIHMGTALGFYNWGVYIGYSLAFAFNFIVEYHGWRLAFWVAAIPGFVIGVVMMVTVREPERKGKETRPHNHLALFKVTIKSYLHLPLILLCIGGGLRNGGGLVWAYNTKAYFRLYYCNTTDVGSFLSWVPLVGGSVGAVLGGVVSDRLAKKRGLRARLWVLIGSQLLATPFLVGVLYLPPPWAFLMLLPAYIVGEMWIGVCLAMVVQLVPVGVSSAAVALYLFIINNIGGNVSLLLPPLQSKIGLRYALLLLYPGCYLLGALFFFITHLALCCIRDKKTPSHRVQVTIPEEESLIQAADSDEDDDVNSPDESLLDWGVRVKRNYDTNDDQANSYIIHQHLRSVVMYTSI